MSLREFLEGHGVAEKDIKTAEEQGPEALQLLVIDRLLVPGDRRYTEDEVLERAGVDRETARKLWRAIGFPDVPEGQAVFTDTDIEALVTLKQMIDQGVVDPDVALQLTRVFGQSLSRMADAQIGSLRNRIEQPLRQAGASDAEIAEAVTTVAGGMLPTVERFVQHLFRRHLAAAAQRQLFYGSEPSAGETIAVGFADLVGFTALSQQLDERELASMVDRFESLAYDVIAQLSGRIVKMLGDEVMFVADEPAAGARIALRLAEAYADDETLPDVRVGLAIGPALAREGDYFGPTVNLASRIVNIAYAGSAVVSDEIHAALEENPEFGWKPLRPRRLKGIGWTPLWVLTRPGDAGERHGIPAEVSRRMSVRRARRRAQEEEKEAEAD
jgi:adenylate cyclase